VSFDIYLHRFSPLPEDLDCEAAARRLCQTVASVAPSTTRAEVIHEDAETQVRIDGPWGDGQLSADCGILFIRAFDEGVPRLVHAVASACDLVAVPVMEPVRFVLVREEQRADLPTDTDFAAPIVCASAEELGAYIEGGYGRWAEFRDRLLKADG